MTAETVTHEGVHFDQVVLPQYTADDKVSTESNLSNFPTFCESCRVKFKSTTSRSQVVATAAISTSRSAGGIVVIVRFLGLSLRLDTSVRSSFGDRSDLCSPNGLLSSPALACRFRRSGKSARLLFLRPYLPGVPPVFPIEGPHCYTFLRCCVPNLPIRHLPKPNASVSRGQSGIRGSPCSVHSRDLWWRS